MTIIHRNLFFRTLQKEREIYALKIATLSIAFACAMVVVVFCWNEFGYDRFHIDAKNVFRVLQKNERFNFEGNRYTDRIPFNIYKQLIKEKIPLLFSRCKTLEQQTISADGNLFHDITFQAVDGSIDAIFSVDFINGSPDKFKNDCRSVLLSESQAQAFFNSVKCCGDSLKIMSDTDTIEFVVAAVFRDFPVNSHSQFNFFVRLDTTSLKKLSVDPNDAALYGRIMPSDIKGDETSFEKLISYKIQKSDTSIQYQLQPLPEIYFGRRVIGESALHGDRYSILMLICIASLIAFLAITNYINLTTLTLPNRAAEIAIKKVAGATQYNVLLGLGVESIFVVLISFLLAVAILVSFNGVISSMLPIPMFQFLKDHKMVLILLILSLLILTIIGPLLIALRFVRAPPSRLLGTDRITFPRFKKIITVLQLGISLSLIVSGIIVQRQITRSLVKEPGRNKDQIVYLPYPAGMTDAGIKSLRSQWRNYPNIEDVTAVSHLPDQILRKKLNSSFYALTTEFEFPTFFRYPIVEGRWFGPHDTIAVVVNRKGASLHPVFDKPIIGVLENLEGLYNQSEKPVEIQLGSYVDYNYLCVRIIEIDVRKTVHYLE